MWTRFVLKPFWARVLVVSGVYAILNAVQWCARGFRGFGADPHQSWWFTLEFWSVYVAGIVISGLLAAAFTNNSHQAYTYALAGLDPAQRSAAVDASFRGPVPADAPVRDAAIRVAWRRLGTALFWRQLWLVLLGLAVLAVGGSLARGFLFGTWPSSGWSTHDWISSAVVVGFTVAAWYVPRSVKNRLQMLGQT
jgi:hypothetical protein